jgi:hypothetical protein
VLKRSFIPAGIERPGSHRTGQLWRIATGLLVIETAGALGRAGKTYRLDPAGPAARRLL